MFDRTHPGFVDFIRESNRIEGILRDPTEDEIAAHERLLGLAQLTPTIGDFQAIIAPGMPIRRHEGMDVRVGNHIAPEGGPSLAVRRLQRILNEANRASACPHRLRNASPVHGRQRTHG